MKLVRPILFFLAAALLVSVSSANKKSELVRNITHAKFVMLTTLHGNQYPTKVPPEDMKALQATDAALRKWGRYAIVYTPEQADLIIVVRAGRIASVHEGIPRTDPTITIGRMPRTDPTDPTGGPVPPAGSESSSAEVGPAEDMLEIFDAHLGVDTVEHASAPLWRKLQAGGLQGKEPPLVNQLRKEVEEADKEDAAKKAKDDAANKKP